MASREPLIHHHVIDKLAVVAGVLSGIALFPQVVQITLSGSIVGVSFLTYLIVFLNNFVWLAYAIHRGLISLGISALLNIVAAGLVLVWFALLSGSLVL
ncbi:MAG TPA: PQ-loop domain-containing transporter [Candidatus Paceibacterota bacterium]|nr:PQ-loop domain-containing transporter [Candidatus Paceibacterota bacterium]